MLKLFGKNANSTIKIMLQEARGHSLEMNGKIKKLSKKIEAIVKN